MTDEHNGVHPALVAVGFVIALVTLVLMAGDIFDLVQECGACPLGMTSQKVRTVPVGYACVCSPVSR